MRLVNREKPWVGAREVGLHATQRGFAIERAREHEGDGRAPARTMEIAPVGQPTDELHVGAAGGQSNALDLDSRESCASFATAVSVVKRAE